MTEKQDKRKIEAREILEVLEDGFKTEKRMHDRFKEFEKIKKRKFKFREKTYSFKQCYGKYQYVFTKGTMKISLVKINKSLLRGEKDEWCWEIFAYEDKRLFKSTRRFRIKKEAIEEVKNIFGN